MKKLFFVFFLLFLSLSAGKPSQKDIEENNYRWRRFFTSLFGLPPQTALSSGGGGSCIGCTLIIALIEQYSQIHDKSMEKTMEELCSFLPKAEKRACDLAIIEFTPKIIKYLESHETPDYVCQQIGICTNSSCNLFPPPIHHNKTSKQGEKWDDSIYIPYPSKRGGEPEGDVGDHYPLKDDDGDHFSTLNTLRGANWRGKDCDDTNKKIYPGRKQDNFPNSIDANCNGIYGTDPKTNKSYESELCKTPQFGVAVLGDSAAAHFHVPPSWMTARDIGPNTYKDLTDISENEFDWPQMSSSTGYTITDWVGTPGPPMQSIYQYFLSQNLCSHRDFQNIGVNGARTGSMADEIMYTLARNQTLDFPLMLTYALIGNDVCNPHPGLGSMTTPSEFYANVLKALVYLDTVLPKGSHISFFGLVDGRILWDSMWNRTHPIGSTNNDVTYEAVYEYLICLEMSPCWGWLNPSSYWRNATSQRAFELNAVYGEIMKNNTFKNFNMTYFPTPLDQINQIWKDQGGQSWQLIEPVDGFHPNQVANALLAEYSWKNLQANFSYLIPPLNPNNQKISELFGDQGGY